MVSWRIQKIEKMQKKCTEGGETRNYKTREIEESSIDRKYR